MGHIDCYYIDGIRVGEHNSDCFFELALNYDYIIKDKWDIMIQNWIPILVKNGHEVKTIKKHCDGIYD